jgi:hypothetical protein
MPYRNDIVLLVAGILFSLIASRVETHSGLTFTSPSKTFYISNCAALSWLSLFASSIASSVMLVLYRAFHPDRSPQG